VEKRFRTLAVSRVFRAFWFGLSGTRYWFNGPL
jgi:hypothetical protein